jgi:hypothetical protein
MLTADQRKELEALEAEMRAYCAQWRTPVFPATWADRIAAVLANGVEKG